MNDIDTIREALEECFMSNPSSIRTMKSALSALERVSALQAEMEAALEECAGHCYNDQDTARLRGLATECLKKIKSR
jgi:hypothetical protein